MAFESFGPDPEQVVRSLGPGMIDRQLRELINLCWMTLPQTTRTLDDVEKEIRRLLDRAFNDLREDEKRRAGQ
jgi:hypothetical protein